MERHSGLFQVKNVLAAYTRNDLKTPDNLEKRDELMPPLRKEHLQEL